MAIPNNPQKSKDDSSTYSKIDERLLIYYFATGIIEGILILWLFISLPSGPSNLWLFGFSKSRIVMMVVVIATIFLFVFLTIGVIRHSNISASISWVFNRSIIKVGYFIPFLCIFFILAVIYPYFRILGLKPDYAVREYVILERLSPFIFYLTSRLLQLSLIFIAAMAARLKSGYRWKITKSGLAIILFSITGILAIAHVSLNLMPWITKHREIWRLVKFFDLTYEKNIPAFFSTFLLACAGFILLTVTKKKSRSKDRYFIHWLSLSFIFILLSLDELLEIHEGIDDVIKIAINSNTLFARNWVYSGIIFVFIFILIFWKFFKHLPTPTRRGILLSGLIYVGSALGLEIIGSAYVTTYGLQEFPYLFITTIEETLEMVGIIIFIYTLMAYLEEVNITSN